MSARSRRVVLASTALAAAALVGMAAWTLTPAPRRAPAGPDLGPAAVRPHDGLPGSLAEAAVATDAAEAPREGQEQPAYIADQLLIGVHPDVDLDALAADYRVHVAQGIGPSGFGALQLDDPAVAADLTADLSFDPRVVHVGPMGAMYGAGKGGTKSRDSTTSTRTTTDTTSDSTDAPPPEPVVLDLTGYQWHLKQIRLPDATAAAQGDVVVAVLDTGVAYAPEVQWDGSISVVAPSLAGSRIVAPWDFVNDDAIASDDNQHGTHIASLIASDGAVRGVAPGAALMPIKVLDWYKLGSELDLLDGLAHATTNGADVINMSLAFSTGYAPSGPLQAALADAADSGAILVAATGNSGDDRISWPAASPAVIAVASSNSAGEDLAWYSNASPAVDLLAPGGNLDVDVVGDGHPDGTLAETVPYMDPSRTGYFFGEGTSQAAALVSGAAARMLAAGVAPADVALALKHRGQGIGSVGDGYGGGIIDVYKAEQKIADVAGLGESLRVHVAVLPYLEALPGNSVRPGAILTALDASGAPLKNIDLWVRFDGSSTADTGCRTAEVDETLPEAMAMACRVIGPEAPAADAAFTVVVESASDQHGVPLGPPTAAFFASDALEVLVAAMKDHEHAAGALPAFYFPAGTDPVLGTLAEHYVAVNSGTGLLSSPMGIVFTPSSISKSATVSTISLDLDGTGLLSSPMGFQPALIVSFSGTGLLSSPMGFSLVTLNGTGLLSSPMGFTSTRMYAQDTSSGVSVLDPTYSGDAVLLGSSTIVSPYASGTELEAVIVDGGWVSGDGGPAASQVLAAGSWNWSMPSTSSRTKRPQALRQ